MEITDLPRQEDKVNQTSRSRRGFGDEAERRRPGRRFALPVSEAA